MQKRLRQHLVTEECPMIRKLLVVMIIFVIGLAAGHYFANAQTWQNGDYEEGTLVNPMTIFPSSIAAQENPKDRIPEKAIAVYKDRIILDLQNAQWATFTDTHSMEPVLFKGANAIEITPKSVDDIKVGDIISYRSEYAEGSIIHRVVYKGQDDEGTYFIMKGDNLQTSDPGRVRFEQIDRVVVAIIY